MPFPIYSAAIDLGATSGRVILGAWSNNQLTLTEAHRFPNTYRELGTHTYWEVGTLWYEIQIGLRKAVAALPRGAKLSSVGVDTWGCDHVLLNDAGRLVFPTHAYRDTRTQEGLAALAAHGAAHLYAATGIPNRRRRSARRDRQDPARPWPTSPRAACSCQIISTFC